MNEKIAVQHNARAVPRSHWGVTAQLESDIGKGLGLHRLAEIPVAAIVAGLERVHRRLNLAPDVAQGPPAI